MNKKHASTPNMSVPSHRPTSFDHPKNIQTSPSFPLGSGCRINAPIHRVEVAAHPPPQPPPRLSLSFPRFLADVRTACDKGLTHGHLSHERILSKLRRSFQKRGAGRRRVNKVGCLPCAPIRARGRRNGGIFNVKTPPTRVRVAIWSLFLTGVGETVSPPNPRSFNRTGPNAK